jgi:hypothetical protein
MVSLIQRFSSNIASTVYAYTPSWSTVKSVAAKSFEVVRQAPSVAAKAFEIVMLPTDFCDRLLADSLKSFSLKKAIEAPLPQSTINGIGYYLELFFEQVKLPFAPKVTSLIKEAMHQPLKLDDETYDTLVNKVISPALTEENGNKATATLMRTLRELIHAVAETEKKPSSNKKQELLKQLGFNSFEDFKRAAQVQIEGNLGVLLKNLEAVLGEGKHPLIVALIKVGLVIVGDLLAIFSSHLTESFYRFTLTHYLTLAASTKGDISFNALGLDFKISKEEIALVQGKMNDYKDILFWAFMQKMTTGLAHIKDQKANVDEEWTKLLDELQPILTKTISVTANHAQTKSWKDNIVRFVGEKALTGVGVPLAISQLYQIEPSVLVKTVVKGVRNGFFSHKAH